MIHGGISRGIHGGIFRGNTWRAICKDFELIILFYVLDVHLLNIICSPCLIVIQFSKLKVLHLYLVLNYFSLATT